MYLKHAASATSCIILNSIAIQNVRHSEAFEGLVGRSDPSWRGFGLGSFLASIHQHCKSINTVHKLYLRAEKDFSQCIDLRHAPPRSKFTQKFERSSCLSPCRPASMKPSEIFRVVHGRLKSKQCAEISALVRKNPSCLNERHPESNWTPLMIACNVSSNDEGIKHLLSLGADADLVTASGDEEQNAFSIACRIGQCSIIFSHFSHISFATNLGLVFLHPAYLSWPKYC